MKHRLSGLAAILALILAARTAERERRPDHDGKPDRFGGLPGLGNGVDNLAARDFESDPVR